MKLYADGDKYRKMSNRQLRREWEYWRKEQPPESIVSDLFFVFTRGAIRGEMKRRGLSTDKETK